MRFVAGELDLAAGDGGDVGHVAAVPVDRLGDAVEGARFVPDLDEQG